MNKIYKTLFLITIIIVENKSRVVKEEIHHDLKDTSSDNTTESLDVSNDDKITFSISDNQIINGPTVEDKLKDELQSVTNKHKENTVIIGDKASDVKHVDAIGTVIERLACPNGTVMGATGDCEVNNTTIAPVRRKLFVIEGCPTGFERAEGMCLEIEE